MKITRPRPHSPKARRARAPAAATEATAAAEAAPTAAPSTTASPARLVAQLRAVQARFDAQAHAEKIALLTRLAALPWRASHPIVAYHEALLFLAAHPGEAALLKRVDAELARLTRWLRAQRGHHPPALLGHGLPWVDTVSRFTHDCNRWLLAHPHCRVALERFEAPRRDLSAVLALTLPALERGDTTAGLDDEALFDRLGVRRGGRARLAFLIDELARLDAQPFIKDELFDALDAYVRVTPTHAALSKAGNRLALAQPVFFQPELLRAFDALALMNRPLPAPRRLAPAQRTQAIQVLKNTMLLTCRETDPATYLDPASLRIHDLERGLACATFGMTPARQLPLESYVGFTLFKNGLAVSYGGAWLFGERALFGMNIFEPFRGGESGFMMCQVLRTYRQAFGVRYFEVDAHQFGLDNPDGIASGAYWFYWRHGFRSLAPELRALAERERRKIAAGTGYRSAEATLLRLTGSNVALNFGGRVPPQVSDITDRVTRLIATHYGGQRAAAEADCAAAFTQAAGMKAVRGRERQRVLAEVALVWRALGITRGEPLALLARMVAAKPADLPGYQRLLAAFLSAWAAPRRATART